jgi:hypothetical protein
MPPSFFEQPVLNSPYLMPTRHHALDKDGQPLDAPPTAGSPSRSARERRKLPPTITARLALKLPNSG